LRDLKSKKNEVGTERDNAELRQDINTRITSMTNSAQELKNEIDEYGNIPVKYSYAKTQREKQDAFNVRFSELFSRQKQEVTEI